MGHMPNTPTPWTLTTRTYDLSTSVDSDDVTRTDHADTDTERPCEFVSGPIDVERVDVHVLWSDRLARGDIGWHPRRSAATLPQRLTAAALPYLSVAAAMELANNVACAGPETANIGGHIVIMLRHRVVEFGVKCSDVDMCAVVMGRAWRRWHAEQGAEVAA